MLFAITCQDRPNSEQIRLDTREAHLAYIKETAPAVKAAGPFLSDDGGTMTGSLIVLEAADKAAAEAWAAGDPYAKAGLFESVTIRPWRWVVGNPDA